MKKINNESRSELAAKSCPARVSLGMIDLKKPPTKAVLTEECHVRGIHEANVDDTQGKLVGYLSSFHAARNEDEYLVPQMTNFEGGKVKRWLSDPEARPRIRPHLEVVRTVDAVDGTKEIVLVDNDSNPSSAIVPVAATEAFESMLPPIGVDLLNSTTNAVEPETEIEKFSVDPPSEIGQGQLEKRSRGRRSRAPERFR